MRRYLSSTLLFVTLLLAGCDNQVQETELPSQHEYTAYFGLLVPVPAGFAVEQAGDTLILKEAANIRNPREMWISEKTVRLDFVGKIPERNGVVYNLEKVGSGSGGTAWNLTARKSFRSRSFFIIAHEQNESLNADFTWVWPIIDGIAEVR